MLMFMLIVTISNITKCIQNELLTKLPHSTLSTKTILNKKVSQELGLTDSR